MCISLKMKALYISLVVLLLFRLSYHSGNTSVILVLYSSELDFNEEGREEIIKSSSSYTMSGTDIRLEFLDLKATSCHHDNYASVIAVTNFLFHEKTARDVIGVVGPSCSSSANKVAKLIQRSGASVRHYHTSSLPLALASKVQESSTGLLPPADLLADAGAALIKHASWSRVLVLYQSEDIDFNAMFIRLRDLLRNIDTDKAAATLNYSAPLDEVRREDFEYIFKNLPIRILFLMVDAKLARLILCNAFNFSATYPKYQWVILKTTLRDILKVSSRHGAGYKWCKDRDIVDVLKYSIFVNFNGVNTNTMSDTLLTPQYLYSLSIEAITARSFSNTSSSDGVRNIPIVLSIQQMHIVSLLTSSVISNRNFSVLANVSDLTYVSSDLVFKLRHSDTYIGIVLIVVNTLLLILALLLHIVTVWFRKEQPVKSSTLPFLHVMFIGFYSINFSFHIYFIQKSFSISSDAYLYFCHLFLLTFPVGSILVMGTILVKIWRLYRIFVHFKDPGKFLSNYVLILFVFGLASVEIFICLFWFILDPFRIQYLYPDPNYYEKTLSHVYHCHSSAGDILQVTLLGYNMILQLCIIFIVFKLHKKIPKCHKHLQTVAVVKMAYILVFLHIFGISTYTIAYYIFNDVTVEVICLGVTMELVQAFIIVLMLLPPTLPILRPTENI